jgi:hypothetical protein
MSTRRSQVLLVEGFNKVYRERTRSMIHSAGSIAEVHGNARPSFDNDLVAIKEQLPIR